MSTGRDDDAFAWGGDDDPTLDTRATSGPAAHRVDAGSGDAEGVVPSAPVSKQTRAPEPLGAEREGEPRAAPALGNVELVTLGVLGGVYALIAIGWLIGGLRLHRAADYLLSGEGAAASTWSGGNLALAWLAFLAPAIWFATVYTLTRRSSPWLRWVLLAAGVLLLLPWPFIMVGTVGS